MSETDLAERARESGTELARALGPQALEAATLLRAMADDPSHPLFAEIEQYSLYGWNSDAGAPAQFRLLATAMADSVVAHTIDRLAQ